MTTRLWFGAMLVAVLIAATVPDDALAQSSPPAAEPDSGTPAAEPTSTPATSQQSPWVWVGAGLAMSLFASGFLVTWLRRRMPPPAPLAGPVEVPFADPE